ERHAEFGHPRFVCASFVSPNYGPGGIECSLNRSKHYGISPTRWSVERAHVFLPMRQAGVLRSQSPACLLSSYGDGQVCAFAKAVASQENAAVVLGLAAGRIDQALPGNKIGPT